MADARKYALLHANGMSWEDVMRRKEIDVLRDMSLALRSSVSAWRPSKARIAILTAADALDDQANALEG